MCRWIAEIGNAAHDVVDHNVLARGTKSHGTLVLEDMTDIALVKLCSLTLQIRSELAPVYGPSSLFKPSHSSPSYRCYCFVGVSLKVGVAERISHCGVAQRAS